MRIAVFIKSTHFHKGHGGLETQNKVLCEGLAQKGHKIFVFAPQRELDITRRSDGGVDYILVPCVYKLTSFGNKKNNWVVKSLDAFESFYKDVPFNLVISQSSAGLGIIRDKKRLGIPIVTISHGTIMGELKTRFQDGLTSKGFLRFLLDTVFAVRVFFGRQREFIHGSDAVIAVSNAVKEALISETYVPSEKVSVVNNGLDASALEEYSSGNLSSDVDILYVGRVIKSKGVFDLVDILADPAFSDTKLHVVGEGSDKEALMEKVSKLGIAKRVMFYGALSHEDAIGKMVGADIFVLPSRRVEGLPMVLVEALFAGLPVIATDIGGISDVVFADRTGILVPFNNKDAFKKSLLSLVTDEALRSKMAIDSKKMGYERFTLDVMLAKYEQVFKKVLV